MLIEHWASVEGDFQQYYTLDLEDELERKGPGRIWRLVNNLPVESRVANLSPSEMTASEPQVVSLRELGGWLSKRGG